MSQFAEALRCLYQDKDAVYLWPEGFAAAAAVCTESRASLDTAWTDLASMTDSYVLVLATVLHTDPYMALHGRSDWSQYADDSDQSDEEAAEDDSEEAVEDDSDQSDEKAAEDDSEEAVEDDSDQSDEGAAEDDSEEAAEDDSDQSDEKAPERRPLDFRKLFTGRKTMPLKGALMRELILRELNDAKDQASNLLEHYYEATYHNPQPPPPTPEQWEDRTQDFVFVAGSYALNEWLRRTGGMPTWAPNDMDVWVSENDLRANRFIRYLVPAVEALGIRLWPIRPTLQSELEGDCYGCDSVEFADYQCFPVDRAKDARGSSGVAITEVHDFVYSVDDPMLADSERLLKHLLSKPGIDTDKAVEPLMPTCDRFRFNHRRSWRTPHRPRYEYDEERWTEALRASCEHRTYDKLSVISTKSYADDTVVCPDAMISRFDLDICQCAMVVNSMTGGKQFLFGRGTREAIARRRASALFVNSYRLPARIQKYEGRGFTFDEGWESNWRAWLATQPPAPTAGEKETRDVETHPAFVSLHRFWTTGVYEQPEELCRDESTGYVWKWKLHGRVYEPAGPFAREMVAWKERELEHASSSSGAAAASAGDGGKRKRAAWSDRLSEAIYQRRSIRGVKRAKQTEIVEATRRAGGAETTTAEKSAATERTTTATRAVGAAAAATAAAAAAATRGTATAAARSRFHAPFFAGRSMRGS